MMTMMVRYECIIIHHSASHNYCTASDVRRWHEKNRKGIGYHLIVEADGAIKKGRNFRIKGAHCRGEGNKIGLGICIMGDNTKDGPEYRWTKEQIKATKELIAKIKYLMPDLEIFGHSDFLPTKCPGYTKEELREMFDVKR